MDRPESVAGGGPSEGARPPPPRGPYPAEGGKPRSFKGLGCERLPGAEEGAVPAPVGPLGAATGAARPRPAPWALACRACARPPFPALPARRQREWVRRLHLRAPAGVPGRAGRKRVAEVYKEERDLVVLDEQLGRVLLPEPVAPALEEQGLHDVQEPKLQPLLEHRLHHGPLDRPDPAPAPGPTGTGKGAAAETARVLLPVPHSALDVFEEVEGSVDGAAGPSGSGGGRRGSLSAALHRRSGRPSRWQGVPSRPARRGRGRRDVGPAGRVRDPRRAPSDAPSLPHAPGEAGLETWRNGRRGPVGSPSRVKGRSRGSGGARGSPGRPRLCALLRHSPARHAWRGPLGEPTCAGLLRVPQDTPSTSPSRLPDPHSETHNPELPLVFRPQRPLRCRCEPSVPKASPLTARRGARWGRGWRVESDLVHLSD